MTKITKTNLTIAYQTSPVEKGVYASFGADETLVSLSYYKNGKPIETLSLDQGASEGYSAKYEYFELGVDGYEGDYSGLQAMGISEEQFDGMNPANQTITLNQLEYKEWLDSNIAYIGRDRTPNYKTYCNFCGKEQKEVKKLIMGPAFGICNECVDLCNDIMKEDG